MGSVAALIETGKVIQSLMGIAKEYAENCDPESSEIAIKLAQEKLEEAENMSPLIVDFNFFRKKPALIVKMTTDLILGQIDAATSIQNCQGWHQADEEAHKVVFFTRVLPLLDNIRGLTDCDEDVRKLYSSTLNSLMSTLLTTTALETAWGQQAIASLGEAESLLGMLAEKCAMKSKNRKTTFGVIGAIFLGGGLAAFLASGKKKRINEPMEHRRLT